MFEPKIFFFADLEGFCPKGCVRRALFLRINMEPIVLLLKNIIPDRVCGLDRTEQDLRLQLVLAAYLGVSAAAASALRLRRQVPALLLGVGLIVAPWLRPRFVSSAFWNRWKLCEFQSHLFGCMFFSQLIVALAIVALLCS